MAAILDGNGLTIETLAEIKEALKQAYIEKFRTGIQLEDTENSGKFISIYADREAQGQEALEGVYYSYFISTASGTALDNRANDLGFTRQIALPSTVVMYAAGTPSTSVLAGQLKMSVDGTGAIFLNSEDFTLGSLVDESVDSITRVGTTATVTISGGHSFTLDSWVFIEGAEQEQYNGLHQITAVTATTFDYEIVGTLPITPATGTIEAKEATAFNAESELTGAIQALEGAITTIETPPPGGGIDRVENADDAILGREEETDPEFRSRIGLSLGITGGSTATAIKAKLQNVPGVTFATVFQNVTDFVDANGLPPHSIRAIVAGGADADIWNVLLYEAVSAGIKMDGTEQTTLIDQSGEPQPVAFSRFTNVRIYVDAGNGLTTNSDPAQGDVFPVDGNDLIKLALTSIEFQSGGDVWPSLIKGAIDSVPGVITSDPEFDTVSPPTNKATITIIPAYVANIDSGDITGL